MKKEYDFKKLKRAQPKYMKRLKEPVTMRLDPQVIEYFKQLAEDMGIPYQPLINYVLRDYANHGLRPAANWDAIEDNKPKKQGTK